MAYRETELVRARKDGVRQAILDAARQLVSRGGFRAAQMSAVASGAGIATGTIYRYFPTQAELFAELFRVNSQREVDAMAAAAREGDGSAARLRNAMTTFTSRALSNRRLAYALIAEPVDPLVEAERLKYRRAYAQVLENVLREGMRSGECARQNAHVSAAALVGALAEALLGPLVRSVPSARESVADSIVDFCLRAVGAQEQ
jgi:AcrR family transcriptional regulator